MKDEALELERPPEESLLKELLESDDTLFHPRAQPVVVDEELPQSAGQLTDLVPMSTTSQTVFFKTAPPSDAEHSLDNTPSTIYLKRKNCIPIFSTKSVKQDSVVTNSNLERFSCPTCFKWFNLGSSYRRHLKTHVTKDIVCALCNRKFSKNNKFNNKYELIQHHTDHVLM